MNKGLGHGALLIHGSARKPGLRAKTDLFGSRGGTSQLLIGRRHAERAAKAATDARGVRAGLGRVAYGPLAATKSTRFQTPLRSYCCRGIGEDCGAGGGVGCRLGTGGDD